ncbi:MAG: Hpt domain-containing protein, partial [Lachnospiraceae bacterium]
MKALFDKLNEWGCDVTSALERCMDDELYIVCLEKFTRDDSFDLLKNKIKEQDYASVFQYAHRLKGVANNLGLMPIAVEFSIIMN